MTLDQEFKIAISELQIVVGGKTQNYAPSTSTPAESREPTDSMSKSREHPWHYLAEWAKADDDGRRREIIREVWRVVHGFRKAPAPVEIKAETDTELVARILTLGEGFEVKDVARALKVTETRVRKERVIDNRDMKTGVKLKKDDPPEAVDAEQHARELAERGMSERQIVMITELPRLTVRRVLGRVAI